MLDLTIKWRAREYKIKFVFFFNSFWVQVVVIRYELRYISTVTFNPRRRNFSADPLQLIFVLNNLVAS